MTVQQKSSISLHLVSFTLRLSRRRGRRHKVPFGYVPHVRSVRCPNGYLANAGAAAYEMPMSMAGTGERIRVVIGDAHAADRAELTQLLRAQPDIDVIGVTTDGAQALQLLRDLRPNIALLDEDLPSFGGSAVARILRAELPDVQIMVLRN
jgi:PleD family two-component response regulator